MPASGSLKAFLIGARTDSAGTAVNPDVDQEELRFPWGVLLRQGITPHLTTGVPNPNAFRVRQDSGANIACKVGSNTAKVDGIVLRGTVAGQGTYLLRLDAATVTTNTSTSDPTNPTRYGVYAFIDDAAYAGDVSRQYAGITLVKGTPAVSPVTPAALATWSAWALLWEFQLPATAAAVTDAILDSASSFDRRVTANLQAQNWLENSVFS